MLNKIIYTSFSLFLILLLQGCDNKTEKSAEDWMPLFNGKDFNGWDIKIAGQPLNGNYKNTFRWEDSMLHVSYDKYDSFNNRFGHIYYNTPYAYYKLKFQYRIVGDQMPDAAEWAGKNSGVMIHSQSAQSMNIDQSFPVSLEMQLLEGTRKGERTTGNICTPGTQVHINGVLMQDHCISSSSKKYNGDQWVSGTIEVYGDSLIRHIINGDTVLTYSNMLIGGGFVDESYTWTTGHITDSIFWINKAGTPLKEGYIALQAESQPVDFRKVELLNLVGCMDPKARNYKDYYIKRDNSKCKY